MPKKNFGEKCVNLQSSAPSWSDDDILSTQAPKKIFQSHVPLYIGGGRPPAVSQKQDRFFAINEGGEECFPPSPNALHLRGRFSPFTSGRPKAKALPAYFRNTLNAFPSPHCFTIPPKPNGQSGPAEAALLTFTFPYIFRSFLFFLFRFLFAEKQVGNRLPCATLTMRPPRYTCMALHALSPLHKRFSLPPFFA